MTNLIALVGAGLLLVYVGLLVTLWRYQERVVFQPPAFTQAERVDARLVRYTSSDGIPLFAYLVGECAPDRTLMIAFHGNADLARWLIPFAANVVKETGACVLLPEYRGYDGVTGTPTYAGSAHDAQAALVYVRDSLAVPVSRTVYFGHSLGTAIATELAAFEAPRALVLQSPFSSARAMGARMFLPGITMFWRVIARVHFDTMARVRALSSPVWVAHGDRDFIIPVQMGRDVFGAAQQRGELLIVEGAGHNDVPEVGGRAYWEWMRRALAGGVSPTATRPDPAAASRAP